MLTLCAVAASDTEADMQLGECMAQEISREVALLGPAKLSAAQVKYISKRVAQQFKAQCPKGRAKAKSQALGEAEEAAFDRAGSAFEASLGDGAQKASDGTIRDFMSVL